MGPVRAVPVRAGPDVDGEIPRPGDIGSRYAKAA